MIPQNYDQWKHCIEVECGIVLSIDYLTGRLTSLNKLQSEETIRFINLYGHLHHQNITGWFKQALQSTKPF